MCSREKSTNVEADVARWAGDPAESNRPASSQTATSWTTTEFEINDTDFDIRTLLTNRFIQDDIEQLSGTKIATCGQYLAPENRNQLSERSLHLFIKGPEKQNLQIAVNQIQLYIQQSKYNSLCKSLAYMYMSNGVRVEKVFVGLHVPPSFDLKNKIQGLNGINLRYIMYHSGALVTMGGHDSGFFYENGQEFVEPLHIRIEHEDNEVLQKGKWLATLLIDTIKRKLTSSYIDSHLGLQFYVYNQPNSTNFQPPYFYPAPIQSIIGQNQQINYGHNQIVQVAANTLENVSQTVQTSVANDKMQISVALATCCMKNMEQLQQYQGPTNIIASRQHQLTIKHKVPIQRANQNQKHQLPFSITSNNLNNVQCTPPVIFTVPTLSANNDTSQSKALITQSTRPTQYIQTPNGQIITNQTSSSSNGLGIVQTFQSGQSNLPANSGLIGMSNIMNNQFIQHQQSDQLGQHRIFQCYPLPSTKIQKSFVQATHLHQIQTIVPQQYQFQNVQPRIIHNNFDEIQSQVISQANIQQLNKYCGKLFTQQTTITNNQLMLLPYQILQPHENGIIATIPQQQQLGHQYQQITDQPAIYNQENDYQQSVKYTQLLPTFNQPLDPSYTNTLNIGEQSGAELVQAGPSQIISNDESDQIWKITVDNEVATSPEKHASQNILDNQAPTGDGLTNNCLNIDNQEHIFIDNNQCMNGQY